MTAPQKDRALPPIPEPTCDWLSLTWYPVHTAPRTEDKAARALQEAGFEVFVPVYREWVIQRRRRVSTSRTRITVAERAWEQRQYILWPRYILVGVAGQGLYNLRDPYAGLQGPVCMDGEPIRIPAQRVCDVYARVLSGEWDEDTRPKRRRFRAGDKVRVADGPLAGLQAVVRKDTREDPREVWAELLESGKKVRLSPDVIRVVVESEDRALTAPAA